MNVHLLQTCSCHNCCEEIPFHGVAIVQVTLQTVTEHIIRNGLFTTLENALGGFNLWAQSMNMPHLTWGNSTPNTKRMRCSGCGKQFLSLWCSAQVRLFDHNSLVVYLEHPCAGNAVDAAVRLMPYMCDIFSELIPLEECTF